MVSSSSTLSLELLCDAQSLAMAAAAPVARNGTSPKRSAQPVTKSRAVDTITIARRRFLCTRYGAQCKGAFRHDWTHETCNLAQATSFIRRGDACSCPGGIGSRYGSRLPTASSEDCPSCRPSYPSCHPSYLSCHPSCHPSCRPSCRQA